MYFVSLPTEEAHHGHPTGGGVAEFSQRMHQKVAKRISQIVGDGITELTQVRSLLRQYIMYDLCKDSQPDSNDRAHFPLDRDLANHIYMAKRANQLSCLDQENVLLKIKQWRKLTPTVLTIFSLSSTRHKWKRFQAKQLHHLRMKRTATTQIHVHMHSRNIIKAAADSHFCGFIEPPSRNNCWPGMVIPLA